jgi:putative DNA primase/helicase
LSGRQKEGLRPAWALLNTGGIANFPVLAGLDGLRIFLENDANGASVRAAQQCASRWYLAGCNVLYVFPDEDCNDLNDELRKGQRQ